FFDRTEVRDVMAYLKVLVNPADDISALRIINTPRRGIGDSTIQRIQDDAAARQCSFMEAVRDAAAEPSYPMRARSALVGFLEMIDELGGITGGGLRDIVETVVDRSGLILSLEAQGTDEAKSRIENIKEFFGVVQEFDETHQDDEDEDDYDDGLEHDEQEYANDIAALLSPFMTWLSLRSDLDSLMEGSSTVTLMTIHSAKGLEFPVVFVAGMEEGIFPHVGYDAETPKEIEEERRLAYVAITRAREALFLVCARSRNLYGSSNNNPPSRFVGEIPESVRVLDGVGSRGFGGVGNEKRGDRHGMYGTGNSGDMYGGSIIGGRRASVGGRANGGVSPSRPTSGSSYPKTTAPKPVFKVGDRVDHKTFGRGVVKKVKGDAITVLFDSGQEKNLLLGFAPIVKID
ncbi:MAG: ATP-binding domain-containing protein, partial [Coriobacteriales bacterium]|nr:ATP-binding domain-containing protein [Coriobacteriales bacterium]